MKEFVENAKEEARKQNLEIGLALSKEQIQKLEKSIVWYEYEEINGDVVYAARKDTKDVKVSSKNSWAGVSVKISSPALDRAKQAKVAISQIGAGDQLGGIINIGNAVTGTIVGLSGNQGSSQKANAGGARTNIEANAAKANYDFFVGAQAELGYKQSKQESKSHTEKAVVTNISGIDENSKITYNASDSIRYEGTKAENTSFVYNNVKNITKEAVELHNEHSSKSTSNGLALTASISLSPSINNGVENGNSNYAGNDVSISFNASASKSKSKTDETIYENGRFENVNEVHNNTDTMKVSGFNQEGGRVTGNIQNLTIESMQNTSKTKGSTIGGSIGIGVGTPTFNINGSKTKGDKDFVENQTTFILGKDSNLKVETLDNVASVIGTKENGRLEIEHYSGKDLENKESLKTIGGSLGTSGVGLQNSHSEREGISRNTVVGNVAIHHATGDEINTDLSKANEITKEESFATNIFVESQLAETLVKPNEFLEKMEIARVEGNSLGDSLIKTIENTLTGDKSQDIGDPERRSLLEIKEAVIRVKTAPQMEIIAKEANFSSKETLDKLKINAIEKFDPNSSELPESVKERKEGLNAENKELVAFYDEKTNKIFVNKEIQDTAEIRALIAREWKISEDLKNNKGKLNDEGQLRATVAGEIAYDEVLKRTEGQDTKLDISKFEYAEMNSDSKVAADVITKEDLAFRKEHQKIVYFTPERRDQLIDGTGDIIVGSGTATGGAAIIGASLGVDYVSMGTTIVPSSAAKVLGTTGVIVGGNKAITGVGKIFNGIYGTKIKETLNPIKDSLPEHLKAGYDMAEIVTEVAVGQVASHTTGINKKYKVKSKYSDIHDYEYNGYTNPGPLAKGENPPINNFYGGRYNDASTEGEIFVRMGDQSYPYGSWYTRIPKESEIQARGELAIKKWWVKPNGKIRITEYGTDKSILDTVYYVEFPKGIPKYKGPVGYQGGAFLGGLDQEQYFIPNSKDFGKVIKSYPIK